MRASLWSIGMAVVLGTSGAACSAATTDDAEESAGAASTTRIGTTSFDVGFYDADDAILLIAQKSSAIRVRLTEGQRVCEGTATAKDDVLDVPACKIKIAGGSRLAVTGSVNATFTPRSRTALGGKYTSEDESATIAVTDASTLDDELVFTLETPIGRVESATGSSEPLVAKDGEFRSARCSYGLRVERAARRFRLVVTPSGGSCEIADRTVFERSTTKD